MTKHHEMNLSLIQTISWLENHCEDETEHTASRRQRHLVLPIILSAP